MKKVSVILVLLALTAGCGDDVTIVIPGQEVDLDCFEFVQIYKAWAVACGFEYQEDDNVCLDELSGRGVPSFTCAAMTEVYLDNLGTDPTWCEATSHSPREDNCW